MAALFVAGKVEESYRRTRDVVNVFHRIHQSLRGQPLRPMAYISDDYYTWRNRLTAAEILLLAQLGFHVQPVHPIVLLINYLEAFGVFDGGFRQAALSLLNDGMRSVACLRWNPPVLACAAIQRVADMRGIAMPQDPQWFRVFDVQAKELELCVKMLERVYLVEVDKDLPLVPEELAVYGKAFKEALQSFRDHNAEKRHRSRSPDANRSRTRSRERSRSRSRSRSRRRRHYHSSRSRSRDHRY